MTKKEKKHVLDIIECEGFDYTFQCYSSFEQIKDVEFHRLVNEYLQASRMLAECIGHEE